MIHFPRTESVIDQTRCAAVGMTLDLLDSAIGKLEQCVAVMRQAVARSREPVAGEGQVQA